MSPTVLKRCPHTGRALTVELDDGRVGYYQRREDDCMAAAVATLMQVPVSDVPDPRIDERLARGDDPAEINARAASDLAAWLAEFRLRLVRHRPPPVGRNGWLGVSPGDGRFGDHVAVMSNNRVVFDPAANWPTPPGFKVAPVRVAYGYTLEPLEAT